MISASAARPYSSSAATAATATAPPDASEELPFELLHLELVARVCRLEHGSADKVKALTDLEHIGYNAGYRLIEKLTREYPKFKDELDYIKFICKDFWVCIFRKQVDNLRTNHQGVFVLHDKCFKFLSKVSADRQYLEHASSFVVFTCGLIRGSLANLGIKCVVTAEVVSLPAVKFQVQVQRN